MKLTFNSVHSVHLPLSTSVPGVTVTEVRENGCKCSDGSSSDSTLIAVSAVSLLLIVTLITVTLSQCLLIIRMRWSLSEMVFLNEYFQKWNF